MSEVLKVSNALRSSRDPESVSLTIKGVLLGLVPVVIAAGKYWGWDLAEADLTELINGLATLAASVMVIYGVLRKFIKK